jgi:hypothetical protein
VKKRPKKRAKKRKPLYSVGPLRTKSVKIQKRLEKNLLKAMDSANARGFTGNFGSKGSLFDDPKVKRAKKNYDKFCDSVK